MANPTQLQQLYLSYFGRPADPGGIAFYANAPVNAVLATFSASAESQALYGSTFGTDQINAIYRNLFNRDAETAGANYWVKLVQSGKISAAAAALTILQSAGNDDQTAINNKLQVAVAFTAALNTADKVAGYAGSASAEVVRKFLATVDSSLASLVTAAAQVVTQIDKALHPPKVVTTNALTSQSDVYKGTDGDDLISGTVGGSSTYGSDDQIDGGGGVNTLAIAASGSFDVGANVTNVQRLAVTASQGSIVTTQGNTGLTDIINDGSTASVLFFLGANNRNLAVQNSSAATTFQADANKLTGAGDNVTLTLSNAHDPSFVPSSFTVAQAPPVITLTGPGSSNQYEALTVVSTGSVLNHVVLATDSVQTSLGTLRITGGTALYLRLAGNDHITTSATTIDASSSTGGVSIGGDLIGATLGAANHNVVLGSGDDAVFFGANLDAGDVANGGAGTDTIGVSGSVTDAMMVHVANFEVLRISGAFGANIGQDAGLASLAGYSFAVAGNGVASATFNNLANNSGVTVIGNVGTLNAMLKTPGGSADTLTVGFTFHQFTTGSGAIIGTLSDVAGLETLHLVSNNADHLLLATAYEGNYLVSDLVTAKQVLTGDTNLSIDSPLVTSSFDASAFTGNLRIQGQAAASTHILGGSGDDNFLLGTAADTVDAGAGNDTITLGYAGLNSTSGADVLTLGAGNDKVYFAGSAGGTGSATSYGAFVSVTDFSVGSSALGTDMLGFSNDNNSYVLATANGTTVSGLAKGSVAQGLALASLPSGIVVGDTMVLQTVQQNAAAATPVSNVSFFKLATGAAFSSDVKGLFASAMGSASITGLAANGEYLVSAYDTSHQAAVVAVVTTGGNADGNTVLAADDFTNTSVAVLGVLNMTATDYGNFGIANLANTAGHTFV
ncbi:MAG: DUF4214 domain-containing protein [Pseudomonadota bacterium]